MTGASSMNEIHQKTAVSTATRRETLSRMASRQKDDEYEYESADETDIGVDPKKLEQLIDFLLASIDF